MLALQCRSELRRREGSLRIPRMHVRYGVKSMRTPLSNMGMGMAFTANNAYEKIGEDISLSDVLHTAGTPYLPLTHTSGVSARN